MPTKASSSTSAVQAAITKPQLGDIKSEAIAPNKPTMATVRPAPLVERAVRDTRENECGFGAAGGTCTYFFFPLQNTMVAMNIMMPGMPKATAGP